MTWRLWSHINATIFIGWQSLPCYNNFSRQAIVELFPPSPIMQSNFGGQALALQTWALHATIYSILVIHRFMHHQYSSTVSENTIGTFEYLKLMKQYPGNRSSATSTIFFVTSSSGWIHSITFCIILHHPASSYSYWRMKGRSKGGGGIGVCGEEGKRWQW